MAGLAAMRKRFAAGLRTVISPTSMVGSSFRTSQIEYLWPDDRHEVENIEVLTPHYRGAHASGKASAGFKTFRVLGARVGGRTGRGGKFDPGLAEELLR